MMYVVLRHWDSQKDITNGAGTNKYTKRPIWNWASSNPEREDVKLQIWSSIKDNKILAMEILPRGKCKTIAQKHVFEKLNRLEESASYIQSTYFHAEEWPNHVPSILQRWAIVPPSIIALIISAAILSKRSAPRAAQSPTLSPTLIYQ